MNSILINAITKYLFMMLGVICFSSCSSSDDGPAQDTTQFVVPENVIKQGLELPKTGGGTVTFDIQASSKPEVTSAASWCKPTIETTVSPKKFCCRVSCDPNPETVERETTITVRQGANTVEVKVRQTAADGLLLEKSSIDNIPAEGGSFEVKLKANGDVNVIINSSWISSTRSGMEDHTYNFTVAPNRTSSERTGNVTFTLGNLRETFTVKQLAGKIEPSEGVTATDPYEVSKQLGLGWNLGNQFDAHINGVADETAWGNVKASQILFDKLAASGIKTVRIPVTWLGRFGDAPEYKIEKAWLDRVAEVVDYAHKAGLNAIVNIHHDGADSQYWLNIKAAANDEKVNEKTKAQISAIWGQIAERFKDYGPWLLFESFNEIHDGGWGWGDNRKDDGRQYRVLNEWNQTALDAIRKAGGNNSSRYVVVPGYVTNIEITIDGFQLPKDPAERVMLTVHYYAPNEYVLNNEVNEWGHTAKNGANWGDEKYMREQFALVKTNYIDKNIPVYIGEMGACNRSDNRGDLFRRYYSEYLAKCAHDNGLAPIIWDNGVMKAGKESSALFNRSNGEFYGDGESVVNAMLKGIYTTDPAYTLQSVYDSAPL